MSRHSRGRRRATIAALALGLWLAGIGLLVRRQYFRPNTERLAEAGLHVNPGGVYYGVMDRERQIGFASSTIDTVAKGITSRDYLVANVTDGGSTDKTVAETDVLLSRALHVRAFSVAVESAVRPMRASGRVDGDTLLTVWVARGTQKPDTQRIHLDGPILLPAVAPLAVVLGDTPRLGHSVQLPVFDLTTMAVRPTTFSIDAESLFVVSDSAVLDSVTHEWHATADTLRAWQVTARDGTPFSGWVDNQGRVVESRRLGLAVKREPYEVAWFGWRRIEGSAGASPDTLPARVPPPGSARPVIATPQGSPSPTPTRRRVPPR